MKPTVFSLLITSLGLAGTALAQDSNVAYDYSYSAKSDYAYSAKAPVTPEEVPLTVPCFTAGELHLDIISLYADPVGDVLSDGVGGGIGVGYFYTENFGMMARAYWWDADSAIHSITASAVLRYPIQSICLAPYIYGGIGGHFDSVNQVGGHLGAGLEFRMTERLGVFADYSYTWADETENWHLYSLGLRVAF